MSITSLYIQSVPALRKTLLVPDTNIDVYNAHKTLHFGHWGVGVGEGGCDTK